MAEEKNIKIKIDKYLNKVSVILGGEGSGGLSEKLWKLLKQGFCVRSLQSCTILVCCITALLFPGSVIHSEKTINRHSE